MTASRIDNPGELRSGLRILQNDFYSVYLTHQLCHKYKVCKIILFLISSDWCSAIIASGVITVSNAFPSYELVV